MSETKLISLIKRAIGDRTLNGFCAEAGLNAGNLSRVLRGQKTTADVLLKIADYAQNGVDANDLFSAAGYISEPSMNKIMVYGTASAGLPMFANEDISGFIVMSGLCGDAEEYFALKISGTSMDLAHIPDGSTVVVRRQKQLADGDIGVFMVDGSATVKKLARIGDHVMLMPVSTDPSHQPQVYDQTTNIEPIGRVIKCVVDI